MAPTEFDQLMDQVRKTDLSVNNPDMQAVIEHELVRWVDSYQAKKDPLIKTYDCFGGPGEIPDAIPVEGTSYSPTEILYHVKARDAVGMTVLGLISANHQQHPLWPGKDLDALFASPSLGGKGLDDVVVQCMCGQHSQTTRDLMMGIIHPSPESPIMTCGIPDAIMRWYGAPAKYQFWDLGSPKDPTSGAP